VAVATRHAKTGRWTARRRAVVAAVVLVVVAVGSVVALVVSSSRSASPPHLYARAAAPTRGTDPTSTSTTTAPAAPTTSVPLPQPAGPGFVAGKVTAVGDSVMVDYQDPLRAAIPAIDVEAAVSRQWGDGEALLQSLKADGQLGADVIIGLGTNGPITDADFDSMMSILGGASRVVFVTEHVDRPWQDPNNAVLARGAARYHNVVLADWATLAAQNPKWFGSDGTHLGIDGPGAVALATLVATTLANG
jgi:hypothetical protein